MEELRNAFRREALALDRQMGQPRFGIIESYDPSSATARVTLQPDGVLTGWVPVLAMGVGNGWGIICPPSPGDQVFLAQHGGEPDDLVVVGSAFAAQGGATPPAAPSGETWLVHKSGSFIKLLNTGEIASKGTWNHTGDFKASGEVYRGFGGGDQVSLGGHIHDQSPDSASNIEQPTAAPTAGT